MPFWFGPSAFAGPGGPDRYLDYLADCLCYALERCKPDERADWWSKFRRSTFDMEIANVECRGISFEAEISAVLSPSNGPALKWAHECI